MAPTPNERTNNSLSGVAASLGNGEQRIFVPSPDGPILQTIVPDCQ